MTRTSAASPPVGGTFDVSFENDQFAPILDIPANISGQDFHTLVYNVDGIEKVESWRWGDCYGFAKKLLSFNFTYLYNTPSCTYKMLRLFDKTVK